MSATIYDLAERAGVSIATVSRVFSGRGKVSDQTRKRVFAAAEELGYEPNVAARNLARKSTQLVSVVVPMLTSYFFMEVIRGIQDRLVQDDYDILVFAAHALERIDGQLERALLKGRADGLLLCSTPLTAERAEGLAGARNPVVLADAHHAAFDSVSVDSREGGYAATRHLLAQGYERIAHIAPIAVSVPGEARRAGYEAALRDAGRDADPDYVVTADPDAERHGYTIEAGYEAMQALLALPTPPDAVFAASDMQALGALQAIREAGLRAPDDVALVGFDDIQTSGYAGLSTLRQPMYEMGHVAADKLLQRIGTASRPVSHTTFSAQLVVRDTCGARARSDAAATELGATNGRAGVEAAPQATAT
ncbi:MAG: LacI family DNA-binding transcriptional regulator [Rubricoccaceae bacterium]|nr:LacI family DNA-binding transcriptional regulator [Rubricoccaceae bacterium]